MWKKFLSAGVASGAFVALCWASGCSTTVSEVNLGEGGVGEGGRADRVVPDSDTTEDGSTSCPGTAPTSADLDSNGGWKEPGAIQKGACSDSDIGTFKGNFQTAKTWKDLVNGLPTGCQTCLYSHEGDANWRVIVADAQDQAGFVNFGACYSAAPGGSAACGKAVQYDEFCVTVSCNDCPDSDFSSCTQSKATIAACDANFRTMISSGCGTDAAKLQALDDACGSAELAAKALCGSGVGDGGGGG